MLWDMAFVGRERELAQLAGALQRGAEVRTSRVALAGPAGMGITRLLDEFEFRMAGLPGLVVARGGATEPSSGVAYHALSEALGTALAHTRDEQLAAVIGPSGHDLAVLLPRLQERMQALGIDHPRPALEAKDQAGSRMAESVLGVLERLGDGGVVLLVLEDLHWADPATRGFVASLLRVSRPLPLCLVVTYQPEVLHRRHPMATLARSLVDDARVTWIALEPLAPQELRALVESILGEPPSGSLMAAVTEGSRGNPLLASQLVTAATTLEGVRLSDPFEQVLGARLDALSADAALAVRLLAAARRPVPRESLLAIRLPDGRITARGLDEARESLLAVEVGGVPGEKSPFSLVIAHELYTEAIEELEPAPERHMMHAALAEMSHASPAIAAWHWRLASRPMEARRAHIEAAEASERIDPGETTLYHYQQALESGAEDGNPLDGAAMTSLLMGAARAAAMAGAFRRAAALMRRAIGQRVSRPSGAEAHPRDAGLRRELGAMHVELGRYRWAGGDLVGGVETMEHALELMPAEPSQPRARALASLAQHLMIDGRFDESAKLAMEARAVAREAGTDARPELGHATCTLGVDVAYLGELDRGLALLEEATEVASSEGRLDDLMRAYANRTTLLDLDSRREAALAVVKEGIRDAQAGGLSATYGAFLRGNAADILFQLGRWEEAEVECRAAMEWPPSGVAWFSPILYLGLVLVESRADAEAARLIGQTLLQLEAVPAGQWTALVHRAAVSLALWRGDFADALAFAAREWERVLETDDSSQIALAASTSLEAAAAAGEEARMRRDLGGVAAAAELAQRVLPEAERHVAGSTLPKSLGARREAELHLETARCHLSRLRGHSSAAAWSRVAQQWASVPIPYQAAKARWWQALASLQAGEPRAAARDPLHEAWRIAASLPARPLQRALLDLSTRARIPLPEGAQTEMLAAPRGAEATGLPAVAAGPATDRQDADRLAADGQGADGNAADGHAVAGQAAGGRPAAEKRHAALTRQLIAVGPGPEDGARTETGRAIAEREKARAGTAQNSFGLSPRELEVLAVVVEGRTNREIAERLFISERTVAVHMRRILAKLAVSGRLEAAGLAIRLGLVPEPPIRIAR